LESAHSGEGDEPPWIVADKPEPCPEWHRTAIVILRSAIAPRGAISGSCYEPGSEYTPLQRNHGIVIPVKGIPSESDLCEVSQYFVTSDTLGKAIGFGVLVCAPPLGATLSCRHLLDLSCFFLVASGCDVLSGSYGGRLLLVDAGPHYADGATVNMFNAGCGGVTRLGDHARGRSVGRRSN
jgi:hypothetical protein